MGVTREGDADEVIAHIDAAIGPPENETDEEHAARQAMIERDHRAREIRRNASNT